VIDMLSQLGYKMAVPALKALVENPASSEAVKKAASDGDTVPAVRASFDRTASVDYIDSISGKDLEVTKVNDKIVVRFAYDKEIPLFGPAYLLIKYRGSSAGGYD